MLIAMRRRFWQPTFSGLNLVVPAVLLDSVCVMLYSLCKVERIALTELNEYYYYYYYYYYTSEFVQVM